MGEIIAQGVPGFRGVLLLVSGLPLLVAVALSFTKERWPEWGRMLTRLAPWCAFPAVVVAMVVEPDHLERFDGLLLGTRLELDEVSRVFLFFTAVVWWLAGLMATEEVDHDSRRIRFDILWLLTMSGNIGVVLARDLPSFLMFFSLLSFASYGLVVHRGDDETRRAGRIYLILLIFGETVLFAAAVLLAREATGYDVDSIQTALAESPRQSLIGVLLMVGFGVKSGLIFLHVALPLAYDAAPASAGAVLSGAASKVGILGWVLFLPLGLVAAPILGLVFIIGGLLGTYYGIVVGLLQRSPKAMLAYSSISQLGFMTLLVGVGLRVSALWDVALIGVAVYALHHGVSKGALFSGLALSAAGRIGRRSRWLFLAGLMIPSLALAGAPWTGGAIAKTALKEALEGGSLGIYGWIEPAAIYAAVGTALLMARFLWTVWPREDEVEPAGARPPGLRAWSPWALMVAAVMVAPWLLRWEPLQRLAAKSLGWEAMWSALWPLLIAGAVVALAVVSSHKLAPLARLHIPPGDICVPVEALVLSFNRQVRRAADWARTHWDKVDTQIERSIVLRRRLMERAGRPEEVLRQWHIGATCLVVLVAVLVGLFVL
ncbi:MAG: complex I subunit 5 family protein [Persicimonas sp.]